jgi:hypothetical protein
VPPYVAHFLYSSTTCAACPNNKEGIAGSKNQGDFPPFIDNYTTRKKTADDNPATKVPEQQ